MNPALAMPEAPPRRRGRWQLLLILAVVVGPMLLATAMYQWRFWVPQERVYHGELIGNGQSRADLGLPHVDEKRWQLLVTTAGPCAEDCQQLVYLARQIQIGLNRDALRASHALASGQALTPDYLQRLEREYPQLARYDLETGRYATTVNDSGPKLWIVDPLGNLVLRYDAKANGRDVLKDLQRLLKLSQIG
jgi:hypothetical protein